MLGTAETGARSVTFGGKQVFAIERIADSSRTSRHVRFVPIPDSCTATKFVLFATSLPRLSIG